MIGTQNQNETMEEGVHTIIIPESIVVDTTPKSLGENDSTLTNELRVIDARNVVAQAKKRKYEKKKLSRKPGHIQQSDSASSLGNDSANSKRSFFSFASRLSSASASAKKSFHAKMMEAKRIKKERHLGKRTPAKTGPATAPRRPGLPRPPVRDDRHEKSRRQSGQLDDGRRDPAVQEREMSHAVVSNGRSKTLMERFAEDRVAARDDLTVDSMDSSVFSISSRLQRKSRRSVRRTRADHETTKVVDEDKAEHHSLTCATGAFLWQTLVEGVFSCTGTNDGKKMSASNNRSAEERLPMLAEPLELVPEEQKTMELKTDKETNDVTGNGMHAGVPPAEEAAVSSAIPDSDGGAESRDDVGHSSAERCDQF